MIFTLGQTLNELGITKNKLAVEAKIRHNTISDLVNGDASSIRMDTLQSIIDTLNVFATENGIDKVYGIKDVVKHEKDV
ncbi:XRE family transcriptional regulator [Bacillus clarus]|uniref:Helix-turn-helix family protein n=1 Tax=Bacillus clarus TaxID=2338372 RepID=A0A090YU73_9BACI|nr:helix-turn-helix transcriptional regulator [Bacillus clarus]KFN01807.1 helix-turn-helix family protein [Bacillus clarus]RFT63469.1 XRE family transcriptional regulator [Bacillus clarus]